MYLQSGNESIFGGLNILPFRCRDQTQIVTFPFAIGRKNIDRGRKSSFSDKIRKLGAKLHAQNQI